VSVANYKRMMLRMGLRDIRPSTSRLKRLEDEEKRMKKVDEQRKRKRKRII
jgi:hypothetical protein